MMSNRKILSRRPAVELINKDIVAQHEDVEEDRLLNILSSLRSSRCIRKPIIIDSKRNIVIDGHHRFNALLLLGVKVVPVVIADYSTDIIDIGSWMYISSIYTNYKDVLSFIEALESLSRRGDAEIFIKLGGTTHTVKVDRLDVYYAMKSLSKYVKRLRLVKMPNDVRKCLEFDVCIAMPKLTVDDIYRVDLRGEVLPPRTTLHITPLKNIYIPYALKKLYIS